MTTPAFTPEAIAAYQAERRAFYATPVGTLLNRFESSLARAWQLDSSETVSDRRLREVWDAADDARAALVAEIKALVAKAEGR